MNNFNSDSVKLGIVDDGYTYETLLKSLYRNLEVAVIRELTRNALDAHYQCGTDRKVDFDLTDTSFYIRDYGNGISHDEIKNIMSVVMKSTKRGDSSTTGGHGLGCKTPFGLMYASDTECQAIMTSIHQGKKNVYELLIDDGMPCYNRVIADMDTDEESGVSYLIDIDHRIRFVNVQEFIKLFYPLRGKINFLGIDYTSFLYVKSVCNVDVVAIKKSYEKYVDIFDTVNSPWDYIKPLENNQSSYIEKEGHGNIDEFYAIRNYSLNSKGTRQDSNLPVVSTHNSYVDISSVKAYIDGLVYDIPSLVDNTKDDSVEFFKYNIGKITQYMSNHAVYELNDHNINSSSVDDMIAIDKTSILIIAKMDSWHDIEANRSREDIVHSANNSPSDVIKKVYGVMIKNLYPWYDSDVVNNIVSLHSGGVAKNHYAVGFDIFLYLEKIDMCLSLLSNEGKVEFTRELESIYIKNPIYAIYGEAVKLLSTISNDKKVKSILFDKEYSIVRMSEIFINDLFLGSRFNEGDFFETVELVFGKEKHDQFLATFDGIFTGISRAMKSNLKSNGHTNSLSFNSLSSINSMFDAKVKNGKAEIAIDPSKIFISVNSHSTVPKGYYVSTEYVLKDNKLTVNTGNAQRDSCQVVGSNAAFFIKDARVYKDKISHFMAENGLEKMYEISYKTYASGSSMIDPNDPIDDIIADVGDKDKIVLNSVINKRPVYKCSEVLSFKLKKEKKKTQNIVSNPFSVKSVSTIARGVMISWKNAKKNVVTYKDIMSAFEHSDVVYWINENTDMVYCVNEASDGSITSSYRGMKSMPYSVSCDIKITVDVEMEIAFNETFEVSYTDDKNTCFIVTDDRTSKKILEFLAKNEKCRKYEEYLEIVKKEGTIHNTEINKSSLYESDYEGYNKRLLSILSTWLSFRALNENDSSYRTKWISSATLMNYEGYALSYYLNKVYGVGTLCNVDDINRHDHVDMINMKFVDLYITDSAKFQQTLAAIKETIKDMNYVIDDIKINKPGIWRNWEYFSNSLNSMLLRLPSKDKWRTIRQDVDKIFIKRY